MLEESSVGGIPCWEESRVIKVNAKAKKYESLGGILLESVTKKKKESSLHMHISIFPQLGHLEKIMWHYCPIQAKKNFLLNGTFTQQMGLHQNQSFGSHTISSWV